MNDFELRRKLAALKSERTPQRDLWPAIAEAIGLGAAVDYLERIGMANVSGNDRREFTVIGVFEEADLVAHRQHLIEAGAALVARVVAPLAALAVIELVLAGDVDRELDDLVWVQAVMHQRRRPGYWKGRG